MKISFHGAARNVTGSKHLLTLKNGLKILLDCGMFQGMGQDTEQLNRDFGFEASEIDMLVLSHAHVDHSGLIPRLVAQGFRGKIYATSATIDLAKILMLDSAKIQAGDLKYINKKLAKRGLPFEDVLYTDEDVNIAMQLFQKVDYNEEIQIAKAVILRFTDAGHIIGSAVVNLRVTENKKTTCLTFSGDVGRYGDMILRSPQPFPQADVLILESTYGNRLHEESDTGKKTLLQVINHTCVEKKGKLIIPAFSVGRTQEVLYMLNQMDLEGQLPPVNVYVDSPLSSKATQIIENHAEGYNDEVKDLMKIDDKPFDFKRLIFIDSVEASKALNARKEACVIISASGMAEAGRVKHHISNCIEYERNSVLFVGYCEPFSLGGRLMAGAELITVFGEKLLVKAEIFSINSMSAHGDYKDLIHFVKCQQADKVKQLFLVHGEYEVQLEFKEKLNQEGFKHIEIPSRHQEFEI